MLEIPESQTIAKQIADTFTGKTITGVKTNTNHKFAFFFGDPADYPRRLTGKTIAGCTAVGGLIEMEAEEMRLLFGDGVNLRYLAPGQKPPTKFQLLLEFDDRSLLTASVQMYGGLWAYEEGENDNPYYLVAKEKPSPLLDAFDKDYFDGLHSGVKPNLSAKGFLATEQRIPGLGNGVLQDILFQCQIHPKSKISSLTEEHWKSMYQSVKSTLVEMTARGAVIRKK